mgnify:FL=1
MNNYRQIGNGNSFALVNWRGERVWFAKYSPEYDEYLEEGIRELMISPPRSLTPALKVKERRVTLQWSAQWNGKTRIVKHVELRETVTTEVFN